MRDYLKRVLELVRPYRIRFWIGLACGFLSGLLAFSLPLSLTLALSAVFPEEKAETSALFSPADVKAPQALAAKLSGKPDAISGFLTQDVDESARKALEAGGTRTGDTNLVQNALVRTLNRAILGPAVYDEARFRGVTLRPETSKLLAENPQGDGLVRLNRLLLEDAFSNELSRRQPKAAQKLQFLPPALRSVVDTVSGWVAPGGSAGRVLLAISLIPMAMLVRGLLGYLNVYLLSWVGIRAANDLKVRLFSHLMHLPLGFFSRMSTGDLMARIEGAMAVNTTINGAFATIIREPISIIVLIFTLIALQPLLSAVTLVVFPVCLIPVLIYGRKLRKSHSGIHEKFASANNVLHESFTGIRVIKGYNLESRMVEQFRRSIDAVTGFFMRSVRASEVPGPLIEFIGSLGVGLIFCYFAFISPGHSQGNLVAFFTAVFSLYAPLKGLSRLQSQLTVARSAVDPAYQLLAVKTTLPEPAEPKALKASGAAIQFRGVSFSYDQKLVLHDINLTIQPGQLVALVGRTGSGKSSLANLLLRFYDPQKGAVLIGDTDIRSVSSSDLRANVAVVTQQTILFNESVRNNIMLGRPSATEAELQEAAKHARAHDFIMERPQRYDAPAGEKGILFSGGQQQRISIARAVLKNAPILILDEALNALDQQTELEVQAALEKLMEGRTTICIAHRLATIERADLIVVLDNGRIVETGTHAELLKSGGVYRRLYKSHFEDDGA
jgi:subfamily B ATP-binding cassette protein MsbA